MVEDPKGHGERIEKALIYNQEAENEIPKRDSLIDEAEDAQSFPAWDPPLESDISLEGKSPGGYAWRKAQKKAKKKTHKDSGFSEIWLDLVAIWEFNKT